MNRASRGRGVVCLLVAVGAGVWFAMGCGATQEAAPTVAAGDLLTIETPSAFTFPKQMTVSVAGVVGSSTASLSKALSADLGPGRHTLGQTLYTAHEDNARLEALLRIFSAISIPTDEDSATGTTSAVGSTNADGVWSVNFADFTFPTLKSDTLTTIDCSTPCSGKLEALPVCATVYIGGKRAMMTKFFAYPSATSYGKGCFYAFTTVTSSSQEAAILDGSENYLIAGLWDGTDTTNPQIDMLSATTVADADGILNRGHRGVFASAITTATTVSTANVRGDLTVSTAETDVAAIHKFDETQDCSTYTIAGTATETDSGVFDNTTGVKAGACPTALDISGITGVTAAAPPSLSTSEAATLPSVTTVSPAASATDVALNAPVTATFSEAMAVATITSATFTLQDAAATAIAGTVSTDGITATFTPSADLAASTTFTAVLTTGITNAAGTALVAQLSWSFTTGTTSDATAPTVSSTSPVDATTHVAITADMSATFDEAIDSSTVTTSSFTVTPTAGGGNIAGTVSVSGTVVTLSPTSNLTNSTQYTATLATTITDTAGNALATAKTWSFTTIGVSAALDPLFATSGVFTSSAMQFVAVPSNSGNPSVVVQSDGKIVMVGSYAVDESDSDVVIQRLNTDGSLDTTFGTNGTTQTSISGKAAYGRGVVIQSDGKIVVVGNVTSPLDLLALRYTSSGALDTSFSGDGIYTTGAFNGDVHDVSLDSSGRIYIAGLNSTFGGVLRLETDGSLSTNWGTASSGIYTDAATASEFLGLAIDADGKVLLAGHVGVSLYLVRLGTDGLVDTSFSDDGIVVSQIGENITKLNAVAIQTDGQIVVCGSYDPAENFGVLLQRYSTSGVLDTGYGSAGTATLNFSNGSGVVEECFDMQLDTSGQAVLVGWANFNTGTLVGRVTTAGIADTTFSGDGQLILSTYDQVIDGLAIDGNGDYVIGVRTRTDPSSGIILRLIP